MAMGDLARLPRPDEAGDSYDVPLDPWQRAAIAAQALEQRAPPVPSGTPPNMGSLYGMAGAGETARDMARTVPGAIVRGGVEAAKFAGNLGVLEDPEMEALGQQGMHSAEQQIEAQLYQPQTTAGEYTNAAVRTVANPFNALGPGTMLAKQGVNAAAGLTGELAARMYPQYPEAARLAGSFVPGGFGHVMAGAEKLLPSGSVGSFGGKIIQPEVPAIIEPAGRTSGIRAYHSSPHDFEKFDFSPARARTGEGAQMYGEGGYFAENPAVSGQGGQYWQQFKPRFRGTPEGDAAEYLQRAGFDREAAVKLVRDDIAAVRANPAWHGPGTEAGIRQLEERARLLESSKPVGPRTYEVNIEAHPDEMLNYDVPLGQQVPYVQERLKDIMGPSFDAFRNAEPRGAYNQGLIALDPRTASLRMQDAGIPGVRYLDAESRAKAASIARAEDNVRNIPQKFQDWADHPWRQYLTELKKTPVTSNYVMFPGTEDKVHIMAKYGLAGAVPTMGSLADMSYREQ